MLIPFKKEHLEVMEIRQHERDLLALSEHFPTILENSTSAITGMINGRIICCGGLSITIFGSAEIWLIPSMFVIDHKIEFLKGVNEWLETMREKYNIKRMQTVAVDDKLHNNYMLFLGFEKEGVMRQYALGKDYCAWGKLWE